MVENGGDSNGGSCSREEQEAALVALIEHRTREVKNLRQRISYYESQIEEAENRLQDSESKLARLRGQTNVASSRNCLIDEPKTIKMERRSISPVHRNEGSCRNQRQFKPELLIPAVNPRISQPMLLPGSSAKPSRSSNSPASPSVSTHSSTGTRVKTGKPHTFSTKQEYIEIKDRGTKRKFEQKEHKELIPLVNSGSSPCLVRCQTISHISSEHKRKPRSLALCPVNDLLFVTTALDGMVNLWQVQSRGKSLIVLHVYSGWQCMVWLIWLLSKWLPEDQEPLYLAPLLSQKQRRWPEDITWHPDENRLFSVYSADSGDSQVSVLNLNKKQVVERVKFLENKPHVKGIINSMPWENTSFATGGSDHAVVLWSDNDSEGIWRPKALHRNNHSSAVMGVAGLQQKHTVLSAGADKRIIGYDANAGRVNYKHQIDSKCMSVLPNPCDFNLFMVQTGTPQRQLRLFDIRLRETELHAFGWKQESSDSQSALINQAWSPDGMYITSGSADPMIHVFDIRYNANKPSQTIRAHRKRVFKAVWLQSLPLLISISSDLNVGFHKLL